jgi:CelD/BcsL family acetyltransferase involved in cellulose biosynthesis
MPETYKYNLIRTTHKLEDFQSSWSALWQQDGNATPFQSPQWLLPWWHQFGTPDLRAVVISNQDRPIAFLPFYVYWDPHRKERQLLLIGAGTADYLDGIFAPECRTEHVTAALDLLRREGGWRVLYAGQLRRQSLLCQSLQLADDMRMHQFEGESCSRMRATPISDLPAKIRRNAMYYRNRATRLGRLELTIANAQNWPAALDALVHLHTTRWHNRGEPGVLADHRVLAWHKEAIPLMLQRGLLRLCSLLLNGRVLGIAYSLIDPAGWRGRTQYVYLIAHSIEHADLRPGTLLLALITERAASEGVDTIDMLRGDEAYKKIWHVEMNPTFCFRLDRAEQGQRLLSA